MLNRYEEINFSSSSFKHNCVSILIIDLNFFKYLSRRYKRKISGENNNNNKIIESFVKSY